MKQYHVEPDLVKPFDTRLEPLPVPATGIFDAPRLVRCVNESWWSHIEGAVSRLLWADAWLGDDDAKKRAVGAIEAFIALSCAGEGEGMFRLRQSSQNHCHLEQSFDGGQSWSLAFDYSLCVQQQLDTEYWRMCEDGRLEYSFDGVNWQALPRALDPRFAPPTIPDVGLTRCEKANNLVEALKREVQRQADSLIEGATAATVVAAVLKILSYIPGAGKLSLFGTVPLTISAGLLRFSAEALLAQFGGEVWENVACALYCALASSDGAVWDERRWHLARVNVGQGVGGLFAPMHLINMINLMGPTGLENASRTQWRTLDNTYECSLCDCPEEIEISVRGGSLAYIVEPTVQNLGGGWWRFVSGTWNRPGHGVSAIIDYRRRDRQCFRPTQYVVRAGSVPTYSGWWVDAAGTTGSSNGFQTATNMYRHWAERFGDPTEFIIDVYIGDC